MCTEQCLDHARRHFTNSFKLFVFFFLLPIKARKTIEIINRDYQQMPSKIRLKHM